MRIDTISIFPEFFNVLDLSLIGKARKNSLFEFYSHDLRSWASGKYLSVDDSPFGGGAGMVMKADVWGKALDSVLGFEPLFRGGLEGSGQEAELKNIEDNGLEHTQSVGLKFNATNIDNKCQPKKQVLLIPSPSGRCFDQKFAEELFAKDQLVFACGRYEGIDSRVYEYYKSLENDNFLVQEFSIGDYVLNGGEVACLVVIEAVTRLIPQMMGNPMSLVEESHCDDGFLEYPIYTRPLVWNNMQVPPVLLSGNHVNIQRFRRDKSIEKTIKVRPDILEKINPDVLDEDDKKALAENNYICVDNEYKKIKYRHIDIKLLTLKENEAEYNILLDFVKNNYSVLEGYYVPKCLYKSTNQPLTRDECVESFIKSFVLDDNNYIYLVEEDSKEKDFEILGVVFIQKDSSSNYIQKKENINNIDIEKVEKTKIINMCIINKNYQNLALEYALIKKAIINIISLENNSCEKIIVNVNQKNKDLIKMYKQLDFAKKYTFNTNKQGKLTRYIRMEYEIE